VSLTERAISCGYGRAVTEQEGHLAAILRLMAGTAVEELLKIVVQLRIRKEVAIAFSVRIEYWAVIGPCKPHRHDCKTDHASIVGWQRTHLRVWIWV
jgi:hypothetical protein